MTLPSILERETERFGIPPTWEVALLFPGQGDWSEARYLALDANRHIEFTDGVLELLPFPTPAHQTVVGEVLLVVAAFAEQKRLARVIHAPFPVRLRAGCFRQPDIALSRTEHSSWRT
jgi:Uma2 family endonuclease